MEVHHFECNEGMLVFTGNVIEPVQESGCIFQLVDAPIDWKAPAFTNFFVSSVQDLFANFSDLGLC